MTEIELKCPFCGGSGEAYETYRFSDVPWHVAWEHHEDCPILGWEGHCYPTEAEAIAAWNTRPEPPLHGYAEGIEAAASLRPQRSAGRPPNGQWGGQYQSGWDDAVIAYSAAIRALTRKENEGGL